MYIKMLHCESYEERACIRERSPAGRASTQSAQVCFQKLRVQLDTALHRAEGLDMRQLAHAIVLA